MFFFVFFKFAAKVLGIRVALCYEIFTRTFLSIKCPIFSPFQSNGAEIQQKNEKKHKKIILRPIFLKFAAKVLGIRVALCYEIFTRTFLSIICQIFSPFQSNGAEIQPKNEKKHEKFILWPIFFKFAAKVLGIRESLCYEIFTRTFLSIICPIFSPFQSNGAEIQQKNGKKNMKNLFFGPIF